MKYSFDTDMLYIMNKHFAISMRYCVVMKEAVDGNILERAANESIKRYPYFSVRVGIDGTGSYVLLNNNLPVTVKPSTSKKIVLGSEEVNFHLAAIDFDDKNIFFNLNHTVGCGPSALEWILTTLYQYECIKTGKELDCPNIRKVDSELLEDECQEYTISDIPLSNKPVWNGFSEKVKTYTGIKSMLNCIITGQKVSNYYLIRIDEKKLMDIIHKNNATPSSMLAVLLLKAAKNRIPKKYDDIVVSILANSGRILGIPNSHFNSSILMDIRYKREMADLDMAELCDMTRQMMAIQTDKTVLWDYWKRRIEECEEREKIKGLRNKRIFSLKHSDIVRMLTSTATLSYLGRYDLGELGAYVDSIAGTANGEGAIQSLAMNGEFILSFFQEDKRERWFKAFINVLDENGISYRIEGPFDKYQPGLKM